MERVIKPEILDTLEPNDPAALHNRRDLRWFNAIMGNYRWMTRSLRATIRPHEPILEIGAGTGDLGFHLLNHYPSETLTYAGLDLWPRPHAWPALWEWHQADLTTFTHYARYPVLIGNFIIHQFNDSVISNLFKNIVSDVRVILLCETARRPLHLYQLPLSNLLGINHVSRHDARVSIEGGFIKNELAELMQLAPTAWDIDVSMTFLGAYRLQAIRKLQ